MANGEVTSSKTTHVPVRLKLRRRFASFFISLGFSQDLGKVGTDSTNYWYVNSGA